MADKIYTVDTATGECELKTLTPYPRVASPDSSVSVASSVDATTGRVTHNLSVLSGDTCPVFYSSAQEIRDIGVPTECFEVILTGVENGVFVWSDASTEAENGISGSSGTVISASGNSGAGRWLRQHNVKEYYAHWFSQGVDGIQAALDYAGATGGGTVYVGGGVYQTSLNRGTDDKWGILIRHSNLSLVGVGEPLIKRSEPSIAQYTQSYPVLFVGVPDSNLESDQVQNTRVSGFVFEGQDTRHSLSGNTLHDARTAIELKNTRNSIIDGNTFNAIDSMAIDTQYPAIRNRESTNYYNLTKNYDLKVLSNTFNAVPHNVETRSLIHAVSLAGVDGAVCSNNNFSWCDDAISGEGTYESASQSEDQLYTPTVSGWSLGPVKRVGKNWIVSNNVIIDSSEHGLYLAGAGVTITGNTISTTSPNICTDDQIKIRCRGCVCTGNTIDGFAYGISVGEPSVDVVVSANIMNVTGSTAAGAVDINADTLVTYHSQRPWLNDFKPVSNIIVSDNIVTFPEAASSGITGVGFRVYSSSSASTDFPNGFLRDVSIHSNTVTNHRIGVYFIGTQIRDIEVTSNRFIGKPFTRSGFDSNTVVNTETFMMFYSSHTSLGFYVRADGNFVSGSNYLFSTHNGSGSNVSTPNSISNNKLDYIKNLVSPAMKYPSGVNKFNNNSGYYFIDRSWIGNARLNNALSNGTSSASALTSQFLFDGTSMRYYVNDSSFITL